MSSLSNLKANWLLYAMLLPTLIIIAVFMYIPMYGLIISFQDFQPTHGFFGSPLVGLKWFRFLFSIPDFKSIMINTVVIAILKIIFGQLVSILFSLMLNELRNKIFVRTIQTAVYLPHFLSWVITGGLFIDLLSTKGLFNHFLNVFGINSIFFMGSNHWFKTVLITTDVWKEFGWNAILYLAALTSISPEHHEAALLDGANRLQRIWHINIPGIMPTIVLLGALGLGNVLNAGFEQVLMMYNPAVYQAGDIIDTFVYRTGLVDTQFSLATAVGLLKSIISFFLIVISYRLAYKYADYRIF